MLPIQPKIERGVICVAAILLGACAPSAISPTSTPLPAWTESPRPTLTMPKPFAAIETPAPRPTATPTQTPRAIAPAAPTLAPLAADAVRVREESLMLQAYPYDAFWREAMDRTYQIAYKKFDADAYNAAPRAPAPKSFKTIVVENAYLRLTFLPELGGRLYQVLYKPTGQTLFYNNRVLKPTPWGPAQQGGWLAAGGMEWALPVEEHGYEWGVPWRYKLAGETVVLWDSDATDRVRAQISVTLPLNAAYFIVRLRIENPTRAAVRLQFWINTQLALSQKNVSPDTEFILPTTQVFVHSTGNDFIPRESLPSETVQSPATPMPWSLVAGRDLSRYKNWRDYLGVFVPAPAFNWMGAYDHASELGIARVFPHERVPGVKLFAFGPQFGGRAVFTDDDSDYFELWGGLPRTFFRDDDVTLAAGEAREWEESWIPFARTGGLSAATCHAVLNLNIGERARIGVAATTRGTRGTLALYRNGAEIGRWGVALDPGKPFREQVEVPRGGQFKLRFIAADGTLLAETP